jgi:phosphohistidine phosphatase
MDDVDRSLAPWGRRDVTRLGEHIRRRGIAPARVLCSPSRRTRQTLKGIAGALGEAEVHLVEELYGADEQTLLRRLRAVPSATRSVMLIGHNPGIQDLALLVAGPGSLRDRMAGKFPTAALATLKLRGGSWAALGEGRCDAQEFVVPKELA